MRKEKLIYEGKILNFYRDTVEIEGGKSAVREWVEHMGGACVVALDGENRVLLEKQYRYGVDAVAIEIPAGKLERGEDPANTAMRELCEETGYFTDKLYDLGTMYPTPAYTSEIIYMYAARVKGQGATNLDDGEVVEPFWMPIEEAVEKILANEIIDGKTQIAILKVWERLKNGEVFE